ncbi:AraC family transcriptional regulator [Gordonia sp. NB41Y]|uniref:AraC-like ligand-binding domain-containing protein n=1 Tax=Gordonia sp. NB41Y TaxID=875808 RepID=UPI0006B21739|nr:AraC family transcriptional regulator [Gordonia sp. NB41Y]EMP10826.2 AraC family transcriptional regulator [Gordonia sp. NB41Y]WLP88769.1 AraC family transcriptional regulator [Gordonia sp. NB41Y]
MAERARSSDSARRERESVLSLRTGELDLGEGRNEWRAALGSLYAEMDVDWPSTRRALDAEWGGRPFGDLHVSTIRCDEQTVIRSPAMIRSDSCADVLVCVVTDGVVQIEQAGRQAVVADGAFALLDLGAPFVFHSPSTFGQVVVRVPGERVAARIPGLADRCTGRAFDAGAGSTAIVGRLLTDIAGQDLPTATAAPFAASVIEMLSAAVLEAGVGNEPLDGHRAQDMARVQRVIADHLHDADLTLPDVAHLSGMSLRAVQKLAKGVGATPSDWLYGARIERAKHLLRTTGDPVSVICEQVGFRDLSHFGRVFRRQTGTSPGRYRAQEV